MPETGFLLGLREMGFAGGLIAAYILYNMYSKKPSKSKEDTKPEPKTRCADHACIISVIETAEQNNKLLVEVLQEVKKNNKLQKLQLLKGVDNDEMDRIVSILDGE